jgi:hypothetical protein
MQQEQATVHSGTEPQLPGAEVPTADNQEGRILTALGLTHGPLPEADGQWLNRYYQYLSIHLKLPFGGEYAEDIPGYRQVVSPVTIVALIDPDERAGHEDFGLICRACRGTQEIELPLADVELKESAANWRLIEDYWFWFWNWRFDPRI